MTNYLAGQASLWVQPDGPNTEPKYLGCHSIGDIPDPKGDTTILWCPDPSQSGKFVRKNSYQGEPGTITTSIETDLRQTADYLESLAEYGCNFPIFVHKVASGRRDVFSNFDRSFVLRNVRITNHTVAKLASRNQADEGETTQSFDLSVEAILRVFNMQLSRISILETEAITSIATAGDIVCADPARQAQKPEDDLWIASKALVGSVSNTADVLRSLRSAQFTVTGADPFTGGMDINGIVTFKIGRTTTRILVANGTTQVAHPAEVAYSDDNGATWTTVHVGAVNGEFVSSARALVALDLYNIWLGTSGGRVYFSGDGGITWSVQENASISVTAIMGLSMYDNENGAVIYTGGEVAVTSNGASWSAVADSGLTSGKDVHMVSPMTIWAVGVEGMYYSMDGGVTFSLRNSYNVAAIDFLDDMFGVAVGGSGTNDNVWTTIDGGYDWIVSEAVANSGFNFVQVVSSKLALVVGAISGGTGFVGKLEPVT